MGSYDVKTIIRLAFYSFVVGGLMYFLEVSPGDIYGWVAGLFAAVWAWLANTGLQYILLGASIVIPLHLIGRMRSRRRQNRD